MTAGPAPDGTSRTEHDALGSVDVPADALWGIHTARSVRALAHSGRRLGDLPGLVRAMADVKVAAVRANERAGAVPAEVADAVAVAADELATGAHADALVADPLAGGGAIAVHANVNEVVANLANLRLGGQLGEYRPVHPTLTVGASQSTADVVHTAARLAVLAAAESLDARLAQLVTAVDDVADRFDAVPALARTCLQDGLAVEARLLFDGAADAIVRRHAAVSRALDPLHEVVLGATVVGTGAGAPQRYRDEVVDLLAARTARPLVRASAPASALQHGDDLVELASALAQLAMVVAKVARDLRLLSSGPRGGFGEIGLPAVMEGSAFFVDKVNPAVPETVVQAAIQVDGLERTVRSAAGQAELHLHPYDLAVGVAVLDQVAILERAVAALSEHALAGTTLHAERSRELAAAARAAKVGP